MIYKCNMCHDEIEHLRTDGDEINDNFICPGCAEEIKETLKKVKKKILADRYTFINPN